MSTNKPNMDNVWKIMKDYQTAKKETLNIASIEAQIKELETKVKQAQVASELAKIEAEVMDSDENQADQMIRIIAKAMGIEKVSNKNQ